MTPNEKDFYERLILDGTWRPGHPIPEALKPLPDELEAWWGHGAWQDWVRPATGPIVGQPIPETFNPCLGCRV